MEQSSLPYPSRERDCRSNRNSFDGFSRRNAKKAHYFIGFGIRIAIDDFGTGYSSAKYLANLPCNILKIDQTFFLTLKENPRNSIIIEAITALAHRTKMQVVAEGIESQELYQTAQSLGCDYVQGHWLGEPNLGSNLLSNSACQENTYIEKNRLMDMAMIKQFIYPPIYVFFLLRL